MANGQTSTARGSRKPTKAEFNAFMCKVLDPLPDAETMDRELPRLEARARAQAKEAVRTAWHKAYMLYQIARDLESHYDSLRILHAFYPEEFGSIGLAHDDAVTKLREAITHVIATPAPRLQELAWKRKLASVRERPDSEVLAARLELIEADEARLAAAAKKGA